MANTRYTANRSNKKTNSKAGGGGLSATKKLNIKLILPIVAILSLVGGYMVFRSFADELPVPQNGKLLFIDYRDKPQEPQVFQANLDLSGRQDLTGLAKDSTLSRPKDIHYSLDGKTAYSSTGSKDGRSKKVSLVAYDAVTGENYRELASETLTDEQYADTTEGGYYHSISVKLVSDDGRYIFYDYTMGIGYKGGRVPKYYDTKTNQSYQSSASDALAVSSSGLAYVSQWKDYGASKLGYYEIKTQPFKTYNSPKTVLAKAVRSDVVVGWADVDSISPDGKYLLSGEYFSMGSENEKKGIDIVDMSNGVTTKVISNEELVMKTGITESKNLMKWSPDGKYLVVTAIDKSDETNVQSLVFDIKTNEVVSSLPKGIGVYAWQPLPPNDPAPEPDPSATSYTEDSKKLSFTPNSSVMASQDTPEGAKRAMEVIMLMSNSRPTNSKVSMSDRTALNNFLTAQKTANKKVKVCASIRVPSGTSSLRLGNLSTSQLFNVNSNGKYTKQCTTPTNITKITKTSPAMPWADVKTSNLYLEYLSVEAE